MGGGAGRRGEVAAVGFIARNGLWSAEQADAAAKVLARAEEEGLEAVRLVFADLHGLTRGKTVMVAELPQVFADGAGIASSLLAKDTAGGTVVPMFGAESPLGLAAMRGAADMVMVPDPSTFRVLPWAPDTGWLLCDLHFDGYGPVPLCGRSLLRTVLGRAAARGFSLLAGIEVEFHLYRLEDPALGHDDVGMPGTPPRVTPLNHGFQYHSELRLDELDPILAVLRRNLLRLGLPLRSLEVEFGPSQLEVTLRAASGLAAADAMLLLRSAIKQVAAREGYHATFMCRPQLPGAFSSGWHLHQSLWRDDANAFAPEPPDTDLSAAGRAYLGGLLAHARGATAFSTPTINGYKRFRPNSLAPDRAVWGRDNRGAMVRLAGPSGSPGQARLENRVGEPAANPYLYLASQLAAGLDGIDRNLDPGPPSGEPYAAHADPLPHSLAEALDALETDDGLRAGLGTDFVDYYLAVKRAEVARFEREVTDWEHREYFRLY